MHRCSSCGFEAKTGGGLASHVRARHDEPDAPLSVVAATERAIQGATHLTDADSGAIEVLRGLAAKIDANRGVLGGPIDNVTEPTYLKYAESLGLTTSSRHRMDIKEADGGSTLGRLRAIRGGKAA